MNMDYFCDDLSSQGSGRELIITPRLLSLNIDAGRLEIQLNSIASLLKYIPKRRVRKILRKVYRLLDGLILCQIPSNKYGSTPIANNFAFEICIVGLDELIAATFRAAKRNLNIS